MLAGSVGYQPLLVGGQTSSLSAGSGALAGDSILELICGRWRGLLAVSVLLCLICLIVPGYH